MNRIALALVILFVVAWISIMITLIPHDTHIQRIEATATMLAAPFITPSH